MNNRTRETNLLIVGAGPFGLALAAHAQHTGLDHLVVGHPMQFWKNHMPEGMYLRSGPDWHIDPSGFHTIERFLAERGTPYAAGDPLSRRQYLDYTQWFQERCHIEPVAARIDRLALSDVGKYRFLATLDSGEPIAARNVAIAVGFQYFRHFPPELLAILPAERYAHTCDLVDFGKLGGQHYLIIGGRQSAFEWAALLHEAGAKAVHVVYRHDTPAFAESDWSWVTPLVDRMANDPGWYRRQSVAERDAIGHRLWAEGRLKLEPWLQPRVLRKGIKLWPRTRLVTCRELPSDGLEAGFDNGEAVVVDQVILATGYKVQIRNVPFLGQGEILGRLLVRDGFPVLDERFQASIAGLYITSMPATADFGPFFAFTVSARISAMLIGQTIAESGQ